MPSPIKASITLRNDHAELARLEDFAGAFARSCGLSTDEQARLCVILEELFTNAVEYGYGPGSSTGSVTVRLRWRDGRIEIAFIDDGQPFDPLARSGPDLEVAAEDRQIGGLGVHIVRSLVDRARYRRTGGRNHLYLVRRIPS